MAKSNLSTALIIGGVGLGAYFLFRKGGITDKIGDGIGSFTDSAGQVVQSITDAGGSVAQTITDTYDNVVETTSKVVKSITDSGIGDVTANTGITSSIKTVADKSGVILGNTIKSIGSAITGDTNYQWTGFKWPFRH